MKTTYGFLFLATILTVLPLTSTSFASGGESVDPTGQRLHVTVPLESLSQS